MTFSTVKGTSNPLTVQDLTGDFKGYIVTAEMSPMVNQTVKTATLPGATITVGIMGIMNKMGIRNAATTLIFTQ